jgi:hypothetical protein
MSQLSNELIRYCIVLNASEGNGIPDLGELGYRRPVGTTMSVPERHPHDILRSRVEETKRNLFRLK